MNRDAKSPLSFAFDSYNDERNRIQRRARLQHVVVGQKKCNNDHNQGKRINHNNHDDETTKHKKSLAMLRLHELHRRRSSIGCDNISSNNNNNSKSILPPITTSSSTPQQQHDRSKHEKSKSISVNNHYNHYNDNRLQGRNFHPTNEESSLTIVTTDENNLRKNRDETQQMLQNFYKSKHMAERLKYRRNLNYHENGTCKNNSIHNDTHLGIEYSSAINTTSQIPISNLNEKVLPNQILPRSFSSIKSDLIRLHQRRSSMTVLNNTISGYDDESNYTTATKSCTFTCHHEEIASKQAKSNKFQHNHDEKNNNDANYGNGYDAYSDINDDDDDDNDDGHDNSGEDEGNNEAEDDYGEPNSLCYRPITKPKNRDVLLNRTQNAKAALTAAAVAASNKYPYHQFAKDYIQIANEYKEMEEYRNNNPRLKKKCLICKQKAKTSVMKSEKKSGKGSSLASSRTKTRTRYKYLSKVFFPCEHRCVCNECYHSRQKWTFCPLCNEEIKMAIDYTGGKEVDEYWDWINEIKPHLPSGFLKSFKRNGRHAVAEAMARSIADDDADDHDGKGVNTNDNDDSDGDADNNYGQRQRQIKKEKGDNHDDNDKEQEVLDKKFDCAKFTSPSQFHNKDVTGSKTCILS